jgi:hypothetical protein
LGDKQCEKERETDRGKIEGKNKGLLTPATNQLIFVFTMFTPSTYIFFPLEKFHSKSAITLV